MVPWNNVYCQEAYRSGNFIENLTEIWIYLIPSLLMANATESMPYAATCQCVVNIVFVSSCLPVIFPTL